MMSVWSNRPQFSHWALFTAAYVLGCGFAKALAIVPGSSVSFWPPGGLLMATLMLTPVRSWPWWILGGALAESFGQLVWFSSGLPIGFLIIAGNVLEAMAGAWLVNRVCGRTVRLETLQEVVTFVVLGACLAPVVSATVGSATLAGFGIRQQTFGATWPLWWIGDATGILIIAPLTLVVVQNWRGMAQLWATRWIEVSIVGLIFLGVAALSLGGGYLPFAYIVMPPLLWAAVRFDFRGAAVILILLALITAAFTLSGVSQFAGDPESQRHNQIMLHLFLAISALSALVVAAISRQHQQALITLSESERQLQQMVDAVPVRIWRTTPAGSPVYFNKRYQDYLRSVIPNFDDLQEPSLDHFIRELIHPEDIAGVRRTMRNCFETGDGAVMRFRWLEKDGAYRWAECRVEPRRDENGVVVQWYGASTDIDDEVRAQEALRDRERRLQQLVDAVPAMIWSATGEGRPAFVNKRFTDVTGTTLEDNAGPDGSRTLTVIHPDDRGAAAQAISDGFKAGTPISMRFRQVRRDGSYRWTETRAEPLRDESGAILQWYGVSTDVHDTVTAQEALREREQELSQLVNMMPVFIRRMTPKGEPIFFNKRLLDFFGLEGNPSELDKPGMSRLAAAIHSLVHADDAAKLLETARQSFASGKPFSMKYRMRRADGAYRWVDTRAEPLQNQSGAILQWYVISLDIDDQMRAEEALRRSERQLQQLVDAVPAMIWSTTPQGTATYLNKRFTDVTGAVVEDLFTPDGSPAPLNVAHPDDVAASAEERDRAFAAGTPYVLRYRQIRRDGTYRWTETRGEPLRDDSGAIIQWYGVSVDIDDLVKAQDALRRSERQLQQLIDTVPAVVWCTTPEGIPCYLNKRGRDITGLSVEDLIAPDGSRFLQVVHPDDRGAFDQSLAGSFKAGTSFVGRYRQRRSDGSHRWVESRAEPLRDDSGDIVQWYGVTVDIDDQVRLYSELEERESRIRRLIDSDVLGIVFWDLNGTLIDANDAFLHMVQYDREDLKAGLDWFAMTPPDWQEVHASEEAEELAKTGKMQAREKEYFRKDGSRVPVLIGAACFEGKQDQGIAYILDLTERKRAEAALQDRERELSQLVDVVPINIARLAPNGDPEFYNKRLIDFLGRDVTDLDKPGVTRVDTVMTTTIHPDDALGVAEAFNHSIANGEPFLRKFRHRRADGVYRWVEGRIAPLRNQEGAVLQWYAVSLDIDDLVNAEEALRQSERELSQLVNMLPVFIRRLTPKGEPIFFNKRLVDFIGMDLAQIGTPGISRLAPAVEDFVHPDEAPTLLASIRRSVATGVGYAMKYRMRRADGVYRWLETRAEPMRNHDGTIAQWYVVSIDVDDEVRAQHAEEALRETSDKLAKATQAASLAELSASIAHEVNQPLAAIVANSHACQRWLESDPPHLARAQTTVERIIRDANSAADVVSRIRALFRQAVEPKNSAPLPIVIAEARDLMAEEAARRRVRMDIDIENNLPRVTLDRVQVQQVLVNLIRNGMEAMDSITSEKVLGLRARRMGNMVQTEVHDRGRGIDSPEKIFEPFYTTKEQGMGMGLAISRSIVESHGGRLWAEGNGSGGATFIFTLPIEAPTAS